MFGKYKHTLDPKGRLFVPAKLREELGSAFYVARSQAAGLGRRRSLAALDDALPLLLGIDRQAGVQ